MVTNRNKISPAFLLGVDGGQTATKAILSLLDGSVLGQGYGPPSDHFHISGGRARNRQAIQGAITAAFVAAGHVPGPVAAVALGLTGVNRGGSEAALAAQFAREVAPAPHVVAVPDYITNLAGASAGGPGVVVIAGGGSVTYGQTCDGREARAGGYGYLLGDEGSAFDIGRRAVIAALRAHDGRDEPTALEVAVNAAFAVAETGEIKAIVYAAEFSRERFSLLAPVVAACADQGDPVARAIMINAGEELGRAALAVVRRIAAEQEPIEIFPTGGVFQAGEIVLRPFREVLLAAWPAAHIVPPSFSPAVGALILARGLCGLPIDAAWLATVRATLS